MSLLQEFIRELGTKMEKTEKPSSHFQAEGAKEPTKLNTDVTSRESVKTGVKKTEKEFYGGISLPKPNPKFGIKSLHPELTSRN